MGPDEEPESGLQWPGHSPVGEPTGVIDRNDAETYARYRDTVLTNIQNFGEVKPMTTTFPPATASRWTSSL